MVQSLKAVAAGVQRQEDLPSDLEGPAGLQRPPTSAPGQAEMVAREERLLDAEEIREMQLQAEAGLEWVSAEQLRREEVSVDWEAPKPLPWEEEEAAVVVAAAEAGLQRKERQDWPSRLAAAAVAAVVAAAEHSLKEAVCALSTLA